MINILISIFGFYIILPVMIILVLTTCRAINGLNRVSFNRQVNSELIGPSRKIVFALSDFRQAACYHGRVLTSFIPSDVSRMTTVLLLRTNEINLRALYFNHGVNHGAMQVHVVVRHAQLAKFPVNFSVADSV